MQDPDKLIPIGKIVDTHGIKGQLKLLSYSGNADTLNSVCSVTLRSADGITKELRLNSFNPNSGRFLIGFKDHDDINLVQTFIGSELCLKRSQLPALEPDEYYWSDLIGLKVLTEDGTVVGVVADIFETGSSDIYVVRDEEREYLIPAIGDIIKTIDPTAGTITITPLDGLLDL